MKKNIFVSTAVAILLASVTGLQADVVKGEAAAKAKVEEVAAKEEFKAKEDMATFKKEAKSDAKKMDDTTKVKELEAKDKADAKTKKGAFKKDSTSDEKKTIH